MIGGSLALALKRSGWASNIVGIERCAALRGLRSFAGVDEVVDAADGAAVERALRDASISVLATPISAIVTTLPQALEHAQVLTDCGSTKASIAAAASSLPRRGIFVPGHPMAGGVHGGIEHARPDLFDSRKWFLCPEGSDQTAVVLSEALVRAAGAVPRKLSSAEHDAAVARASHLPQLLASALAVVCERAGACEAGGPAYERMTRGAGGPEVIWADIFAGNSREVAAAIDELVRVLQGASAGLTEAPPDVAAALRLLAEARVR